MKNYYFAALTQLFSVVTLTCVLIGCAGTYFGQFDVGTVQNGQTIYSQVIEKYGKPYREDVYAVNGKLLKTITYFYASTLIQAIPHMLSERFLLRMRNYQLTSDCQ